MWGVGIGVAALALAAVIIALTVNRGVDALDSGTPEGVVQRYLQAIVEEEYEDAYALLSEEAQSACAFDKFLDSLERRGRDEAAFTARLDSVRVRDDTATVRVRIEERRAPDGLLYNPRPGYEEPYRLTWTGGGWRLTEPGYPAWACKHPSPVPLPTDPPQPAAAES